MGVGRSKPMPLSYEEACKRGETQPPHTPLYPPYYTHTHTHTHNHPTPLFPLTHTPVSPCHAVPGPVLTRIQETFKRLSSVSGSLPQLTFMRDVLGDAVPIKLAEVQYSVCVCVCDCPIIPGHL